MALAAVREAVKEAFAESRPESNNNYNYEKK
jgi:hypothetical protein